MDYDALRKLGIAKAQELAGKVWTDYNTHDPGITMLEALSFMITDLGHRVNFDIKDLLAKHPFDQDIDLKNFYTACHILPNCPVTFNDFRKLIIDTEVFDPDDPDCTRAGVRNAWISKSADPPAELPIYVDRANSLLSLTPIDGLSEQELFYVKVLYDVLLEFDACDAYGDLNSNRIETDFTVGALPENADLEGAKMQITAAFPYWDEQLDWDDPLAIQLSIENIAIRFTELHEDYKLKFVIAKNGEVVFSGEDNSSGTPQPAAGMKALSDLVNAFIYDPANGMLALYHEKRAKVREVVSAVRDQLHANRNLCEDYFRFKAVRIEDVLLCADIELSTIADVDEVYAQIMHAVGADISPQVTFRTLEEMLDLCRDLPSATLVSLDASKRTFTIADPAREIHTGEQITLLHAESILGVYTVDCIKEHKELVGHLWITVEEEIEVSDISEDDPDVADYDFLIGTIDESDCLTVDQIFEGPKLKHGFIDDGELTRSALRKYLRVSDLIQVIMDIEGVLAVKTIQIANKPQGSPDGIPSRSVKWCLELAIDQCYVPRLSVDESRLTFYKDQLPFFADQANADALLESLNDNARSQKIYYPKMDIDVPHGTFMDVGKHASLLEEFPLAYGVGAAGVPDLINEPSIEQRNQRVAFARQHQAFLMFFDQLAANYLAQLEHVKYLFSMNGEKDTFGEYLIDRTYFAQTLYKTITPDAGLAKSDPTGEMVHESELVEVEKDRVAQHHELLTPLYADKGGHGLRLLQITEDESLYHDRRNRFLDHLLSRFAESFSDYALLTYKVSGARAPEELIEDKLLMLNAYPELSAGRGKGMNYCSVAPFWHVDNVSGLEKRAQFLLGIAPRSSDWLHFQDRFAVVAIGDAYVWQMTDATDTIVLQSDAFGSKSACILALELAIAHGALNENYSIQSNTADANFHFVLTADDATIGTSIRSDYSSDLPGGDADTAIQDVIDLLNAELDENPLANRKSLACPISAYITYAITVNYQADPDLDSSFTVNYSLYENPFDFVPANVRMEGSITTFVDDVASEAELQAIAEERAEEVLFGLLKLATMPEHYAFDPASPAVNQPYHLILIDNHGDEIGRSIHQDFNSATESEIKRISPKTLTISGSSHNDGTWTFQTVKAIGPAVRIRIVEPLDASVADGTAQSVVSLPVNEIQGETRTVIVQGNWEGILRPDQQVTLVRDELHRDSLGVLSVTDQGSECAIYMDRIIPVADGAARLEYSVEFPIVNIDGQHLFVDGLRHLQAVSDHVDWVQQRFFEGEGMHLIEHTLLRPRMHEASPVPVVADTLDQDLVDFGTITFPVRIDIVEADPLTNRLIVPGNHLSELTTGTAFRIIQGLNAGEYSVSEALFSTGQTFVAVNEDMLFRSPDPDYPPDILEYHQQSPIESVLAATSRITVDHNAALQLLSGDEILINASSDQRNDGKYVVQSVADQAGKARITLSHVYAFVSDSLMPINLDQDCESCKITDPYSCIGTVVLPAWTGRFTNIHVRRFVEKTIRREAPAYMMLNICWIDCAQMDAFERAYRNWLQAMRCANDDNLLLHDAQDHFIDIISNLSNVYPPGTLHSCDEDDDFEGSIILNQSVLGTQ